MRSFWISLLGFVLLMCSCRTKNVARLINEVSKENIETNYVKYQALADTSNALKIEIDKSKLKIIETIIITEYDAESGKPIKETKAKRETAQDSDKVFSTEEERRVSEVNNDSLNHFREVTKMMESDVKEETKGGQESFGKWSGIVLGCFIGFLFVYLLKFFRVN